MLVSRSARRARRLARGFVADHPAVPSRPKVHIKPVGLIHGSQSRAYALDAKEVDWLNIGQVPDEQLPDLPSEEEYKKQQQQFQELARKGTQNADFDLDSITLPPGEAALEKLQSAPLKATAPPIKAIDQLELKRLMDIFNVPFMHSFNRVEAWFTSVKSLAFTSGLTLIPSVLNPSFDYYSFLS